MSSNSLRKTAGARRKGVEEALPYSNKVSMVLTNLEGWEN